MDAVGPKRNLAVGTVHDGFAPISAIEANFPSARKQTSQVTMLEVVVSLRCSAAVVITTLRASLASRSASSLRR